MMEYPVEETLSYPLLALFVLAVFYGVYFAKMLAQKRRGIQTRQIGKRKEKSIHTVELLMSIANDLIKAPPHKAVRRSLRSGVLKEKGSENLCVTL